MRLDVSSVLKYVQQTPINEFLNCDAYAVHSVLLNTSQH